MKVLLLVVSCFICLSLAKDKDQITYLIRHGEKPADDTITGLSPAGQARAKCLSSVFGANSTYNIGYILAQDFEKSGGRNRPFQTVTPLAAALGIKIDHSCDRDDTRCVKDAVKKYQKSQEKEKNPKRVLICWEHKVLTDIADVLGIADKPVYPGDRFDVIWTVKQGSDKLTSSGERCPGDRS
ncbi:putative phosphoglycerate mutase family protein [Planoprotostelium fungivorum]|uniref:Putative phosphoglycerate mutase family protein n=1 Tax=Planoprotostelium fungivorum TaxID=1890364 RepID=A0A2P6NPS7_9EUKA|nr:putative phosphoglycerate mutase family protein [Planoprotostelium fungivorum]